MTTHKYLIPTIVSILSTLAVSADIVTDWNATLRKAIRYNVPASPGVTAVSSVNPPFASRQMAIMHLALHDAVQSYKNNYYPYYITGIVSSVTNEEHGIKAAISAAAKTLLDNFYANKPGALAIIQADYTAQIDLIPDGADKTNGMSLGTQIANAYLTLRSADGSNTNTPYTITQAPGVWRPTLPNNAAALLPGWGDVTPFGVVSSDQFLPYSPTDLTSASYATELNLTKEIGSLNSTTRTAEQSNIAQFWADGSNTETPPGHWMKITGIVATSQNLSIEQNARLHALVGMSVADAGISCWKCKYVANFWRPITAIREADTDGNSSTVQDAQWLPFLNTPPFPEYTSGHSTFSRAAATILKNFFGTDNISFTTNSDFTPPLPNRTYTSFNAAADESGMSRIYGGIHFQSGNILGQMNGHLIGQHNFTYYLQPKSALQFSFIKNGNGAVTMQAQVAPNENYEVQTSTDLISWTTTTLMSSATGVLNIIDSTPAGTQRFYRLLPSSI